MHREKVNKATKEITVNEPLGLHCRPSASFVKVANQFESEIFVEKDGERVNGKSILGLLLLAVGTGSRINVTAVGTDAVSAVDALETLARNGFVHRP